MSMQLWALSQEDKRQAQRESARAEREANKKGYAAIKYGVVAKTSIGTPQQTELDAEFIKIDSSPTEDELKDIEANVTTSAYSIDRLQRILARLEDDNEDLMDMIDRITRPPLSCLVPSALQKLYDMLENLSPDPSVLLGAVKLIINILTDPVIAKIELTIWYSRRYLPALIRAYNRKAKRWNKAVELMEKELKRKLMKEDEQIAMEDPERRELIEKIRELRRKKDLMRHFKAYYKIEFRKISSKKCPKDYEAVALAARGAALDRLQAEGYDTSMFEDPIDSDDVDWSGVED